jgi:CRISPR type IV-associated protein Csf3
LDAFKITLNLATPVVTQEGGYMTLDGLLAALKFEATGELEQAHNDLPLQRTQGVWHASAAHLDTWHTGRIGFVANLRAAHDMDIELIARKNDGQPHSKLGLTRRSDFGAVMNSYNSHAASTISWYAQGDADEVERMLQGVAFIGKRRASGFGQVNGMHIEPDELNGVTGYFGEPLRPVPVAIFRDVFGGDTNSLRADAAWRPAYWHPDNRAICHVPESLR